MATTRGTYIELIRRQIYGGFPPEDAEITVSLVNLWLNQGIAAAAQKCYTDNLKMDGIAVVNNAFYTTFKNLTVTKDGSNLYKITLPEVPAGIGATEGVSTLKFKDNQSNELSYPIVWLTMNQVGYHRGMRTIPNKLLGYLEGGNVFVESTLSLTPYTAQITMISGGDSTDLTSTLNVPPDYLVFVTEFLKQQLNFERYQPVDDHGDGIDQIKEA